MIAKNILSNRVIPALGVILVLLLTSGCSRMINNLCRSSSGDSYHEAQPRKQVTIPLLNDFSTTGYLFRPLKNAKRYPAVIIAHTLGGSKDDQTNLLARRIAQQGFITLIFDLDGHGTNTYPFEDESIVFNISKGIDYLFTLPQIDRENIFVAGANLGAALAIKAGAFDWRIKGIVAIEPLYKMQINPLSFISEANVLHIFSPAFIKFVEPGGSVVTLLNKRLTEWNIRESIAKISPRPILLIHGEDDGVIDLSQVQELYDTAIEPKTLRIIPHAKYHTLLVRPETSNQIVAWLQKHTK